MQGQTERHDHPEKPCNICGNVGSKDALVTCSECCIACEHVYCMRVFTRVIPKFWVCEECLSKNGIVSPISVQGDQFLDSRDITHAAAPSTVCVDSQGPIHHKKLKPYETGKVKYLPIAEAIRLSSGAQRTESHENKIFRTAMPSEKVIPKLPNPRVKGSTRFKLPSHGGALIIRKNDQKTAKTSEKSKDKCGAKEVKISEPKMKEIKRKNANADYARNAASCGSSTLMCSISISTGQSLQAVAGKNSSFQERDLLLLPKLQLYCLYLPSIEATWNGKFLFSDNATLGEFYGGFQFQAHPPCKIHRKAYRISQNLPSDLQFKLLPRYPLWEDLFGDGSPDFHDIALYFFPADSTERSKHNFSCLFELLETKNLVMGNYIDGVELLISTSKQLHVDSQKIIARSSTQHFLWGIFRRPKPDQNNLHQVHKDFPSLVSPMECACDGPANMDNGQVVDMDIDMEGGRSVGRVDVVVLKELY